MLIPGQRRYKGHWCLVCDCEHLDAQLFETWGLPLCVRCVLAFDPMVLGALVVELGSAHATG